MLCRRVFNVCRTNSLINLSGNKYSWSISNDGANDGLTFKRNGVIMMSIDQSANVNIAMINGCCILSNCSYYGNAVGVNHGGSGVSSFSNVNSIILIGSTTTTF